MPQVSKGAAASFAADGALHLHGSQASTGPSAEAVRTGRPQVLQHFGSKVHSSASLQKAKDYEPAPAVALPLSGRGEVFGTLTVYSDKPEAFDAAEISLLEE